MHSLCSPPARSEARVFGRLGKLEILLDPKASCRVWKQTHYSLDKLICQHSIERFQVSKLPGQTPCLTPRGRFWIHSRARFMSGPEALSLQGIWAGEHLSRTEGCCLQSDLAGNAFNGFDCTGHLLAWFIISAEMHKSRCALQLSKASLHWPRPSFAPITN